MAEKDREREIYRLKVKYGSESKGISRMELIGFQPINSGILYSMEARGLIML